MGFYRTRPHHTAASARAGRVLLVSLGWALLHSLFASHAFKRGVAALAGIRARNGCYRLFYIAQSVVTLGWTVRWFLRQPDRELYHVASPWSWLLRAVQAAALGVMFSAIRVVGFGRFLGLRSAAELLGGRMPHPEPEAQGPPLVADGTIAARGPFRFTRHPANLPMVAVIWCVPRMTVNRLTLALVLSVYVLLGSLHEDHRLRAAYGAAFRHYQRSVPFLLPRWRRYMQPHSHP